MPPFEAAQLWPVPPGPTDPCEVAMPTDPRSATRLPVDAQLRAEHEHKVADLAQLEAEYAVLLEDPSVLQEDRDATRLLVERAREALAATDEAMRRVADGTYGRCTVCGTPIPAERLEAVPDATTCVSCSSTR